MVVILVICVVAIVHRVSVILLLCSVVRAVFCLSVLWCSSCFVSVTDVFVHVRVVSNRVKHMCNGNPHK